MFLRHWSRLKTAKYFSEILKPRLSYSKMTNLPNIFVRKVENEDFMRLAFTYTDDAIKERLFTFNRSKDEELSLVYARMQMNIDAKRVKKNKKMPKNSTTTPPNLTDTPLNSTSEIPISLNLGSDLIEATTKNKDAWVEGAIFSIGPARYEVVVNFPTIHNISLPKSIMAGYPVYPKLKSEFTDEANSIYKWYTRVLSADKHNVNPDKLVFVRNEYWELIGDSFYFVPHNSLIGKHVKLVCEPRFKDRIGKSDEILSPKPIEAGPGVCPFEERHLYTESKAPHSSFRCVSYNILADLYADSKFSRENLFPYCPTYALEIDYRKQLLQKEIIGYKADLICLQEVDRKVFQDDLNPLLKHNGFGGVFHEKGGQVVEGLATFFDNNRFRLVSTEIIILSECLEKGQLPEYYDVLCKNEKLKTRVIARTTAFQVTVLESIEDPSRRLLVGNIHLYFHPDADHIRLFQASCCLRILQNELQNQAHNSPDKTCSLIFSGDFNSCPEFGVYKLITTGKVEADLEDWRSNPEEAITDLSVSHDLSLDSACGCPAYTNYTLGFQGCLDYIFYDKSTLHVTDIVPMPSHESVTQDSAIPNALFPSDHLAIVCTLQWT